MNDRDVADVCVVGSVNEDIVVGVTDHPGPGETILGGDWFSNSGGKGANQAVAAARLGRTVAFVGAIGADDAGATQRRAMVADGINTSELIEVEAPTGRAFITVADGGENRIVVSPGANNLVTPAQVSGSAAVRSAKLVLVQLEIPLAAVAAVIATAEGIVVVNPAPAPSLANASALRDAMAGGVDVVVPNEGEMAQLLGIARAESVDELTDQARSLQSFGAQSVIVTLGSEGVLVVDGTSAEGNHVTAVPATAATVVDTTAAGDSFCGALGDALVGGASLTDAARWGTRVASVTVSRPGAQSSIPTRDEVPG